MVEKGLAPSRERAQALILSGNVLVNDTPVTKAGQQIAEDSMLRVRGADHPYVSRGGVKLAAALDQFGVNPSGLTAMDVGASTGGFTDVLLMRDARKVYALDVGHNQLAWKIRQDPRVVVHEKIIPALLAFAHPGTDWITLIKPQFEVGREKVGKGGIVGSEADRQEVVDRLRTTFETLGLVRRGLIESPIAGTDGNKEFLAHWQLVNPLPLV
jgi:23S rRNA (cytidine1920-2'-O)/16S rRNA (cytidine1409-2'-O)-methyltransferase